MSVPEAAGHLGVHPNRVLRLIHDRRIDAERVAGRWVIDPASLPTRHARGGRPMSPRIVWALFLHPDDPSAAGWLHPDEAYRLNRRARALGDDPEPLERLHAWARNRADVERLNAPDPAALLADHRTVRSGISDARTGLAVPDTVGAEVYVQVDDYPAVAHQHLLVPAPRAQVNVTLHRAPILPTAPVSVLLLAADLADHGGPREWNAAAALLDDWLRR